MTEQQPPQQIFFCSAQTWSASEPPYLPDRSPPSGTCLCAWLLSCSSCVQLCDPMNCSLPGSSVQGILQARILEQVAMPSSRGFSPPRDRTQISCLAGGFFVTSATHNQTWVLPGWGASFQPHRHLVDTVAESFMSKWLGEKKGYILILG